MEENLLSLGILEKIKGNDNDLSLNVTALTSILMSQDEKLLKDISKIVKAKSSPKRTKSQVIRDNLKENIVTTNEELREAYSEWVDSVYAKDGWMSKKAVVSAQAIIDEFSQHDLDIALKVLDIATINGYRDMSWAVNTYKKDYNIQYHIKPVQTSPVELSSDKF